MVGAFSTSSLTELNIKLPELIHTAMITADFHVTNVKSNYDLIFGRDLLRELGINLNFKNNNITWRYIFIPMKAVDSLKKAHFAIQEPKSVQNVRTQNLLLKLLQKYEGNYTGSEYKIELKQDIKQRWNTKERRSTLMRNRRIETNKYFSMSSLVSMLLLIINQCVLVLQASL